MTSTIDIIIGRYSRYAGYCRLPYLLDGGLDVVVAGGLVEAAGQVNHRHVRGGHSERHAGQLAVQLGDNLGQTKRRKKKGRCKQKTS